MTVDIDQDEFDGVPAERLFSWIERLPAYEGALAARIYQLQQEEKNRNPSRDVVARNGNSEVPDVVALMADPDIAQHIEHVQV